VLEGGELSLQFRVVSFEKAFGLGLLEVHRCFQVASTSEVGVQWREFLPGSETAIQQFYLALCVTMMRLEFVPHRSGGRARSAEALQGTMFL